MLSAMGHVEEGQKESRQGVTSRGRDGEGAVRTVIGIGEGRRRPVAPGKQREF